MQKYIIGLLTCFFAVLCHAENTVEASVAALPSTHMMFDQPVKAFALVLGVLCISFTFLQAFFRHQPAAKVEVKVSKD